MAQALRANAPSQDLLGGKPPSQVFLSRKAREVFYFANYHFATLQIRICLHSSKQANDAL